LERRLRPLGSGPQGALASENSLAGPCGCDNSGRASSPRERIKGKEIAGVLKRKEKLKQASQESWDVSLTSILMLNLSARDTLEGASWRDLPYPLDVLQRRKVDGTVHRHWLSLAGPGTRTPLCGGRLGSASAVLACFISQLIPHLLSLP